MRKENNKIIPKVIRK